MIIYKYELEVGYTEVKMLKGGKILSFQNQHEKPVIWVQFDQNSEDFDKLEKRSFMIFGTGHIVRDNFQLDYIGTSQFEGGNFVGHLFEILNK